MHLVDDYNTCKRLLRASISVVGVPKSKGVSSGELQPESPQRLDQRGRKRRHSYQPEAVDSKGRCGAPAMVPVSELSEEVVTGSSRAGVTQSPSTKTHDKSVDPRLNHAHSSDDLTRYGLGSRVGGRLWLNDVPLCPNDSAHRTSDNGSLNKSCEEGVVCEKCRLVKYCSDRCQRQDSNAHQGLCRPKLCGESWTPSWLGQARTPVLKTPRFDPLSKSPEVHKNHDHLPYNLLGQSNDGIQPDDYQIRRVRLCLVSVADVRNVVETINALPSPTPFQTQIEFLINNPDPIVLNRLLLLLFVLLAPGPSIEEAAELGVHLMCSAFLTKTGAAYVRHCASLIFGAETDQDHHVVRTAGTLGKRRSKLSSIRHSVVPSRPSSPRHRSQSIQSTCSFLSSQSSDPHPPTSMTFHQTLKTRGLAGVDQTTSNAELKTTQPAGSGIKRVLSMVRSSYSAATARSSRATIVDDPLYGADDRDDVLSRFERPEERLALARYWETGILSPFEADLSAFEEPNRAMFSSTGEWLSTNPAPNPMHGWNLEDMALERPISSDGLKTDVLGSLFFHIKQQFIQFASRLSTDNLLRVSFHLTQYTPKVLCKVLAAMPIPDHSNPTASSGVRTGPFDRIDLGDLADQVSDGPTRASHCPSRPVGECLNDWAPLLNHRNPDACILMHSRRWYEDLPRGTVAREHPHILDAVKYKLAKAGHLETTDLQCDAHGTPIPSPQLSRIVSTLDLFVDHEPAFIEKYLKLQGLQECLREHGLERREIHKIHPKRIGAREGETLPNLSKEAFYKIFVLGGADAAIRFVEFGVTTCKPKS